jgi:hypothetical protein
MVKALDTAKAKEEIGRLHGKSRERQANGFQGSNARLEMGANELRFAKGDSENGTSSVLEFAAPPLAQISSGRVHQGFCRVHSQTHSRVIKNPLKVPGDKASSLLTGAQTIHIIIVCNDQPEPSLL